jgi:hypothetical protein
MSALAVAQEAMTQPTGYFLLSTRHAARAAQVRTARHPRENVTTNPRWSLAAACA